MNSQEQQYLQQAQMIQAQVENVVLARAFHQPDIVSMAQGVPTVGKHLSWHGIAFSSTAVPPAVLHPLQMPSSRGHHPRVRGPWHLLKRRRGLRKPRTARW